MNFHIGEKIKTVVEKRGITKAELARRLNMSSTNIHKIFNRKSIDTGLLTSLSKELEFDFFNFYENQTTSTKHPAQKRFTEEAEKYKLNPVALSKEIARLKEEMMRKEKEFAGKEIAYASKEILYLKKINELLEDKNRHVRQK
ncbi:MAG: hypothetical protein A3H98_06800 [Bacteroidetes bacterium RIFCSPLOWO2_02_FULL_36_8]|nr:MAG: hypothetical protein A3H98_06800 [Bacteroidetes bacterium RIFCSPLOWO2_02_FULL_36_8]OFY71170.1 MAG: hypothetical protein A3G23_15310 [Bacteroidetes bacterium RIFCSPLOWO2_12_FULL_37_12]